MPFKLSTYGFKQLRSALVKIERHKFDVSGCGVYSRAAFVNILALRCSVYSRAAFIRGNTVVWFRFV